jgi:ribonucleoside-diphosphate reductase alpha chain
VISEYQNFIHTSRYARWLEEEGRRETWAETVDRYVDNIVKPHCNYESIIGSVRAAILNMEVMPSMRAMMTAGPAANRDNTCIYNCAYLPVDRMTSFAEAMFILLCGTGVGFSVERQEICKLPEVKVPKDGQGQTTLYVGDSKEGWASSLNDLIHLLYDGANVAWNLDMIRPAGAPLKTFGGRASGPEPLNELFTFIKNVFTKAQGRKLTSIECHDIMCKIADVVVVGGVRRSAMISLSNLSDDRMRHAKSGAWWQTNNQRALSNNSAVYTDKPTSEQFLQEWLSLVESKSGERGIFNRPASQLKAASNGRRDGDYEFGTNPCSEIILRPRQFCNLTEVVVRAEDNMSDLRKKVEIASFLGTVQSMYTDFPFLNTLAPEWKQNTEEERLLGVSLTGILDSEMLRHHTHQKLEYLRDQAIRTNKAQADLLGIPQSTAITCVKPSGTVSQLVDSASGIHPRYSEYYIRTVRADNKDPLTQFMKDKGFPHEPSADKPDSTTVFSFPTKAPKGCVTRKDISAIDQLELWLTYSKYWCEHKPSCTVYVKEDEWVDVAQFVYKNFDDITGVAFLPYDDHEYKQAPYQEITEDEYVGLLDQMPRDVDWTGLSEYEGRDSTRSSQTLACSGDFCEVVDID